MSKTFKDELEAYSEFLRELTKEVRELYGELTIYRLMYGRLPYDEEGQLEVLKMMEMSENARPLQSMLYKASKIPKD